MLSKIHKVSKTFQTDGIKCSVRSWLFFQCDFHRHLYHGSYNLEKVLNFTSFLEKSLNSVN